MIDTVVNWDFSGNWMKLWKNSDVMKPYKVVYNEEDKCLLMPPELGTGSISQIELKKEQISVVLYDCSFHNGLTMLWKSPLRYYGIYFDFSPVPVLSQLQPSAYQADHYYISYGTSAVTPVFGTKPNQRLYGMSVMIAEPLFHEMLEMSSGDLDIMETKRFQWEHFFGFSSINKDMCHTWTDFITNSNSHSNPLYLKGNMYRLVSLFLFKLLNEEKSEYNEASKDVKKLIMLDHIIRQEGLDRVPVLLDAAVEVMMSKSKFKTLFKKHFGLPYYNYYRDLRLQEAKTMLSSDDYTVQQVFRKLGYKSASTFAQSFIRKFGISPSEVRKQASDLVNV